MHGILHSLQIGTLSAWLSFVGFGTVGIFTHPWHIPATTSNPPAEVTEMVPADFLMETLEQGVDANDAPAASPLAETEAPSITPDLLLAPPELAPLAEMAPLPEIPDLPPPPPAPANREARESSRPSQSTATTPSHRSSSPSGATRSSGSRTGGSASGTGTGTQGSASRLAAGRMPAPVYPPSARRSGQSGSVLVEFTIGTDGRVLSAHAKSPCRWAALNEAAVRAVRRWKFPPGGVMTTQRRLDFVLSN